MREKFSTQTREPVTGGSLLSGGDMKKTLFKLKKGSWKVVILTMACFFTGMAISKMPHAGDLYLLLASAIVASLVIKVQRLEHELRSLGELPK